MKDPSDNRNYTERQACADVERTRYLAKLKAKSERRENNRVLREMAIATGEEHARESSAKHLESIATRSEFRVKVRDIWHSSHKTHEELHYRLGQLYRERLVWFVGRSLEDAASVRSEFEQQRRNRTQQEPGSKLEQAIFRPADNDRGRTDQATHTQSEAAQVKHSHGNALRDD